MHGLQLGVGDPRQVDQSLGVGAAQDALAGRSAARRGGTSPEPRGKMPFGGGGVGGLDPVPENRGLEELGARVDLQAHDRQQLQQHEDVVIGRGAQVGGVPKRREGDVAGANGGEVGETEAGAEGIGRCHGARVQDPANEERCGVVHLEWRRRGRGAMRDTVRNGKRSFVDDADGSRTHVFFF